MKNKHELAEKIAHNEGISKREALELLRAANSQGRIKINPVKLAIVRKAIRDNKNK